jgi:hypothetical protein
MTDLPVTKTNLHRLFEVADAARNLAYFCRHSLDTGPISKHPSREARLWKQLRLALQALDNKVDGI